MSETDFFGPFFRRDVVYGYTRSVCAVVVTKEKARVIKNTRTITTTAEAHQLSFPRDSRNKKNE